MNKIRKGSIIYMKCFLRICALLIVLIGGFGIYKANQTLNIFDKYTLNKKPIHKNSVINTNNKIKNKESINLLLLGVDNGALKRHFAGRSDTIMILSLNPKTHKSSLTSVPRDMGAVMPRQAQSGPAKLNTAYILGGPQAIAKCVKQKVKVPLDGYVIINMGGMEDLLKAVHGVHVKSNLTFTQDWYHFKKGHYYHLHGKKALAYIRERHEDPLGDYGRQIRQRQIFKAIVHKLTHSTVLLKKKNAKLIAKHMQSDLNKNDLLHLGLSYRKCLNHIKMSHVQGHSQMVNNPNYGLMEIEQVSSAESKHVTKMINKNNKQ